MIIRVSVSGILRYTLYFDFNRNEQYKNFFGIIFWYNEKNDR